MLKVLKKEPSKNITSSRTGRDYTVMPIECANDRGDVVRINGWGAEIGTIGPQVEEHAVSQTHAALFYGQFIFTAYLFAKMLYVC